MDEKLRLVDREHAGPAAAAVHAIEHGFELFEGGPILQALRRILPTPAIVDAAAVRALIAVAVTWLPLCVLSVYEGHAFRGVALPFFHDIQLQVRLLVTLPLFVVAAHRAHVVGTSGLVQFVERGIVRERDYDRFVGILRVSSRWNHSVLVRAGILAAVLLLGHAVWKQVLPSRAGSAWYGDQNLTAERLTMAGQWVVWVANPVFQYVHVLWFLRLVVYAAAFARIAALDLHLVATHPDHAGGIGFLGGKVFAFYPLAVAEGSGVAGILANRIFHGGQALPLFKMDVAIAAIAVVATVLAPFCMLMPKMLSTKRKGAEKYDRLAMRYVRQFEERWTEGGASHRPLLGAADIQSLADLGNSCQLVGQMRLVPFNNRKIVYLFIAFLAPIAPLLLTVVPAEELLNRLIGAFIG
jgi:hypothetical protein